MNDETVSPSRVPLGLKNAYVLLYQKDQGQVLEQVVSAPVLAAAAEIVPGPSRAALLAAGKKRKAEEDEEDIGVKAIAPSLPADPNLSPIFKMPKFDLPVIPQMDPATSSLSAKIKAVGSSTPSPRALAGLQSLMEYGGDTSSGPDEPESVHEPVASTSKALPSPLLAVASTATLSSREASPSDYYPADPPTPSAAAPTAAGPSTIEATNFYGKSSQDRFKKRRHSDENARDDLPIHHRLAGKSKARRKDRRDYNSPFSKSALRANLGDDRSGSSILFAHRPNRLSAKDRMRPKKHMLI
ncbi:hypothetical protein BS47DRAFT_461760 [Hydnum rufescens UP504]|uniref:Uncharacterized protein n=1 Tax=Hydnum rufescens UP504 TaxID=1448309 RepID=A0A9P6AHW0_9AGAM|nr:hypothetical protein BS47DRAFT_461760 [Hydnum rufescens UP504]